MKLIWLTNTVHPEKDKYGPTLLFSEVESLGYERASYEARERHAEYLSDKILGDPKETKTYTVQQLKDMDMVGVYMPFDQWEQKRVKNPLLGIDPDTKAPTIVEVQ